jgi:hypothetical protein
MFLYQKDPKNFTKKLLDLISTFSKVAGYKNQYSKLSNFFIHNAQTFFLKRNIKQSHSQ